MVLRQVNPAMNTPQTPHPNEAKEALKKENVGIYHGIMGTGQSLSVGFQGQLPNETPAVPYSYKLDDTSKTFNTADPSASSLQLAPLTEPIRKRAEHPDLYPNNIEGQTPHSAMAAQIAQMHSRHGRGLYRTVHSVVGQNGAPMWNIRKREPQGNAYEASLFEAQALTRLVREQDNLTSARSAQDETSSSTPEGPTASSLQYDAIVLTHGEADALLNNEEYGDDLEQLLADYTADLAALTGQQHAPILIHSQQSSFPFTQNLFPALIQAQWAAQFRPGNEHRLICAGPKYQYEYAPGGVHLPRAGYQRLGEKYGQAYYETVVEGRPFQPLHPISAVLKSAESDVGKPGLAMATVLVSFYVPVPPLVWDDYLPVPHCSSRNHVWAKGRGFEVRDKAGRACEIVGVDLLEGTKGGSTTIAAIRLVATPKSGALPLQVAYAMTQDAEGGAAGLADGRMGHLCDSELLVGACTETKRCFMQHGSREVWCEQGWGSRASYDIVEPGAPEQEVIVAMHHEDEKRAWLAKGWKGETGERDLRVAHNQRNYCVSFVMEVNSE